MGMNKAGEGMHKGRKFLLLLKEVFILFNLWKVSCKRLSNSAQNLSVSILTSIEEYFTKNYHENYQNVKQFTNK